MDAAKRKAIPLATGCIDYFPDALAAVADLSRVGGEQHNPGMPLFWDKSKSTDHGDALMRHFIERGTFDVDGVRHSAKVAWRALALLQTEIERENSLSKVSSHKPTEDELYALRYKRLRENWIDSGEIGLHGRLAVVDAVVDGLIRNGSHPMHAESLRDEYNKADGETGV